MIRLYTKAYPADGAPRDREALLTGEQHSALSEAALAARFGSRRSLMNWYLSENGQKLPALAFLIERLRAAGPRHLLSLGAGPCVLEALAAQALEARVTAADFDAFFIDAARRLLPEIAAERFDFLRGDPAAFLRRLSPAPDAAVFFGSSYAMDDASFVRLLAALREAGAGLVIDFQAGYIDWRRRLGLLSPLRWLKGLGVVRRAFASRAGQFHGYARSRRELRRVYGAAGFRVMQETAAANYPYVAVLGR